MPRMRPRRRKVRWSRLIVLLAIVGVIFTTLSWAAVYAYNKIYSTPVVSTNVETSKPPEKLPEPAGKYINILLLGLDDGDQENSGAGRRSDTMIVASLNKEDGKVNLLFIPRDTKVNIPGQKGSEKITHAFFYGGSELAVRTVQDLLQISIHHTVVIDWQAFIKAVDLLGGVDLYVENNMNYEDPYANLVINLTKGYQHLDGSQSGQYVRFRSDELGDIGRVQRQQRFLKALTEQSVQFSNLVRLPFIIHTVAQYVTTDITGMTALKIANHLKTFNTGKLHTEMLPGKFATVDGLSYWIEDKEQTKQLIEWMFIADNSTLTGI